jgi:hypothetical protein
MASINLIARFIAATLAQPKRDARKKNRAQPQAEHDNKSTIDRRYRVRGGASGL